MRALRALQREVREAPLAILRNLPGSGGRALRAAYWRARLGALGRGATIGKNVEIVGPEWVFIGDDCWVDDDVTLIAGPPSGERAVYDVGTGAVPLGRLEVGSRVHIGRQVIVQAHGGVRIGSDLSLGPSAKIYSLSHHHRNPTDPLDSTPYLFGSRCAPSQQMLLLGNVIVGDGAAVAMNASLLPGAHLADYAWLGAGGVLGRSTVPRGALLRGNPAEVYRMRPGFGDAS